MRDGKHVILCVDDDPDYLEMLRTVLEANGYAVAAAAGAEEALRAYPKEKPDLVIADLMMEEIDSGANFVKELKFLGCTAPIYLLSSVGDAMSLSVDPAELGVDGVFQKPLDPKTLIATLDARLKKK